MRLKFQQLVIEFMNIYLLLTIELINITIEKEFYKSEDFCQVNKISVVFWQKENINREV